MHGYKLRDLIAVWEREQGRRLSLKELAEATGIARPTLSKMVNPKGYVTSTRNIERLCRFFRVSPAELIYFDPPILPDRD
jgi:DNA-binding Xre family transcriptional regulator